MRNLKATFFCLIFLLNFFLVLPGIGIINNSSPNNINNSELLNPNSLIPSPKLSAEQDNVDSFDVNPKSGRWQITDDNTNDTIIDSNLFLNNTYINNPSSYFSQRGLTSSDSKFEYRYKTRANKYNVSNIGILEFYEDAFGNISDFNDGTTEDWEGFQSTDSNFLGAWFRGIRSESAAFSQITSVSQSLAINSTFYHNLRFRYNSSVSTTGLTIFDSTSNVIHSDATARGSDQAFIIEIDLGLDADWSGIETDITIRFAHSSSAPTFYYDFVEIFSDFNFEFQIDSLNTTGAIGELFTIGLYDQDNLQPLLNISQNFFNDSVFRWQVNLMDSSNNIVSFFHSDNQTFVDVYYRAKVTFNVLTSEITVELKTDGNTRIFRVEYPDDFTNTGAIPQLFAHEKAPDIYFSSFTHNITSSETFIDFIEASYKEKEWRIHEAATASGWGAVSPFSQTIGNTAFDEQKYRINIPYLDSFSGSSRIDASNTTMVSGGSHLSFISIRLLAVDKFTGDTNIWADFQHTLNGTFGSALTVGITSGIIDDYVVDHKETTTDITRVDFSFSLINERSAVSMNLRVFLEDNGTSAYDISLNTSLSETILDNPSDTEFLIETVYGGLRNVFTDGDIYLYLDNFAFLERDIFQDIVGGIIATGGFIADLLGALFSFIAIIIRFLLIGIFAGLNPLMNILQKAMETAISALGSLIVGAIVTMQNGVTAAVDLVTIAVDLVTDAVEAVGSIISDILSDIGDIFLLLGTFIIDILSSFLDWIFNTLVPLGISLMFGIWDEIWTPILNLIGIKAFVDGLVAIDFTSIASDFTNLITVLADLFPFLVIIMLAFITVIPFVTSRESNGKVNMFSAVNKMANNSFGKGYKTPQITIFGIGGSIFIPLIILVYISIKILIAAGTFPDIFGGLPI